MATLEQRRAKYRENKDAILASQKLYYARNKEKILDRNKKWVEANREHWNAYSRERRKANLDHYHALEKAERTRNRDKHRERNRKQQRRPSRKRWLEANRDRLNTWRRAYYARNREKYRVFHLGRVLFAALMRKWDLVAGICYICNAHVERDAVAADHVIPKSKGGLHVASNLMPVHKKCNSSKGARLDYPVARPDLIEVANG